MSEINDLYKFRAELYKLFPSRRDAITELIDAISSYGYCCKSIVELCEAPSFTREYTSITDAVSDGLGSADFKKIENLVFDHCTKGYANDYYLFGTDGTPNPRPHAKTLEDRSIIHASNCTPGQKPIALGHQYSVTAWMPMDEADKNKHWLVPIAAARVPSSISPNEFGIIQLTDLISQLGLDDQLVVGVADSAYGSQVCRQQASKYDNFVHIYRLKGNRKVYSQPKAQASKRQKYGEQMVLNNDKTHKAPDEEKITKRISANGTEYKVTLSRWHNMLFRGTREFKAYNHPFDILKVELRPIKENGDIGDLVGKPMWLTVYGKRRSEISTINVYRNYSQRFDLEHFFRFGKNKLLMTSYQTPDVVNEELFAKLCMVAHAQLFLARNDGDLYLKKWERYGKSSTIKNGADKKTLTPTQAQRSFSSILNKVGTFSLPAKKRGKSLGRQKGDKQVKREKLPIVIKGDGYNQNPSIQLVGFEKNAVDPNLESLTSAIKSLPKKLKNFGFTPELFTRLLQDTAPFG